MPLSGSITSQGVRDELTAKDLERQLLKLGVFETAGPLASEAARNCRTLRNRGRTVRKTIGCLIGDILQTRAPLPAASGPGF